MEYKRIRVTKSEDANKLLEVEKLFDYPHVRILRRRWKTEDQWHETYMFRGEIFKDLESAVSAAKRNL